MLFDRVRGRLVPTPEGQLFFREVAESFRGMDRLRARAASIRDVGSGEVRIGSLSALGATVVPQAIGLFRTRHPKVRLTVGITSSASIRDAVADGQLDVGLVADEIDRSGLDAQPFSSLPGLIALPPDHKLAQRDVLRPEDLRGVPMVALAPEDRARQRFDALFTEPDHKPIYVIETPSSSTVCALVLSTGTPGLVNCLATEGYADRGLILRPFEPEIAFKSLIVFPPQGQQARLVREFAAMLRQARDRLVAALMR